MVMFSSNNGDYGRGAGVASGFQQFLGGLFGGSDRPYKEAGKSLEDYLRQAREAQNPFYNAGVGAIPQYQEFLSRMKDPSAFINNLMGGYNESPFAKYQQQQATRAALNQGSASGLTGSTPLMQFAAQNARDISSQDMNQFLQNVLGVNSQYGAGLQGLISGGQGSANAISDLLRSFGGDIAGMRYGQEAGRNIDRSDLISGLFNMGRRGLFG